ncbi:MAG TPA: hypothetical protein VIG74_01180 [Alphaproteobacteria bacterium]|jgi:hypothetical protein
MENQKDRLLFPHLIQEEPERGYLKKLYNSKAMSVVTGVVTSAAVKFVCAGALATMGAPAVVSLTAAAALAGAVKGVLSVMKKRDEPYESDQPVPGWTDKESLKTIGMHAAISGVSGGLFAAFSDTISDGLSALFGTGPAPVVETVVAVSKPEEIIASTPEPVPAPVIVTEAIAPKLSAQAIKDQAAQMFATDRTQAVALFQQAEAMGNTGAGIDMAFMEYHGFGGLTKDPSHAIEKMQTVLDKMSDAGKAGTAEFRRGQSLLEDWMGFEYPAVTDIAELAADADTLTGDMLEQEMLDADAAEITREALEAELAAPVPQNVHPIPYPTVTPL